MTELCIPYLVDKNLISPVPEAVKISFPPGIKITQTYLINETGEKIGFEVLKKIISIYQERLKILSEISELTDFFFKDKLRYEKGLLKWKEMTKRELNKALDRLKKTLSKIEQKNWTKENLEKVLLLEADNFGKEINKIGDKGYLLWPFRVALTGKEASAGPFEIAEILGKEKCLKRIKEARKL